AGALGRLDRPVHVHLRGLGQAGEDLAGGRIRHRQQRAAFRPQILPVNPIATLHDCLRCYRYTSRHELCSTTILLKDMPLWTHETVLCCWPEPETWAGAPACWPCERNGRSWDCAATRPPTTRPASNGWPPTWANPPPCA